MQNIYNRVAAWNSKRYNRDYNKELTISLLREEYEEWLNASNDVEKLDALCDITYVALGAIWKLNPSEQEHNLAEVYSHDLVKNLLDINEFWPAYFTATLLDTYEYSNSDYPAINALTHIKSLVMMQALSMGLSFDDWCAALLAVCDSNDSKSAVITASHIKANDKNKGMLYFSPTAQLTKILEKTNGRK